MKMKVSNPLINYRDYVIAAVTIFVSIGGSWEANLEKNADQDKDIAVCKVEIQSLQQEIEEQKACAKEILNTVNRIDKTTMELKASLNLKEDKHFYR
jgi:hypothetical protein